MKSIILVEGPDCSGKSTLVDRLKNTIHWDSLSLHHRDGDQFSRYLQVYSSHNHVVFNRGHVSEAVYGRLWREGNPFTKEEWNVLNDVCNLRMLVIVSFPSIETMRLRYQERKYSQQLSFDELDASRNLFEHYTDRVSFVPLWYHSESFNELEELVKKVKDIVA